MKKSDKAGKDYRKYRDKGVLLFCAAVLSAGGFFAAGYVFCENTVLAAGFSAVGVPVFLAEFVAWRRKRIAARIEEQFADVLQAVLAALSSGQTLDRAFLELAEGSLGKRFDLRLMMQEIRGINQKVMMNYSFYEAFADFAERSGSQDIRNISDALKITGTRGGNLVYLIRNALANLRVKLETDREIRHTLALPRYNHRILTVMPFFLILMLKSISYEYIRVLYDTRAGQIVSVAVAVAILAAWILGDRLCQVKF